MAGIIHSHYLILLHCGQAQKEFNIKIHNTEVIRMKAGAWLAQLEKVDLASQDIEALLDPKRGKTENRILL